MDQFLTYHYWKARNAEGKAVLLWLKEVHSAVMCTQLFQWSLRQSIPQPPELQNSLSCQHHCPNPSHLQESLGIHHIPKGSSPLHTTPFKDSYQPLWILDHLANRHYTKRKKKKKKSHTYTFCKISCRITLSFSGNLLILLILKLLK